MMEKVGYLEKVLQWGKPTPWGLMILGKHI